MKCILLEEWIDLSSLPFPLLPTLLLFAATFEAAISLKASATVY